MTSSMKIESHIQQEHGILILYYTQDRTIRHIRHTNSSFCLLFMFEMLLIIDVLYYIQNESASTYSEKSFIIRLRVSVKQ